MNEKVEEPQEQVSDRPPDPGGEAVDQKVQWERAERLRETADDSARHVRSTYITFLLVGSYIAVTVFSTTHEQLLKVSPVMLPLLNVGLPIFGFYAVVPCVFLVLHFNLLLQLHLLARKLHAANAAISALGDKAKEEQLTRLFPFPFSHMLIGHHLPSYVRAMLSVLVFGAVIFLPALLFFAMQLKFISYHSVGITWLHRTVILLELGLLWLFWPVILEPSGIWRDWFKRFTKGGIESTPGALLLYSLVACYLSFFYFSIPGERFELLGTPLVIVNKWIQSWGRPVRTTQYDREYFSNLRLAEKILVAGEPPLAVIAALTSDDESERRQALQQVRGLVLSNRDLRFADLRNTVLVNADLRGANLEGADLQGANLSGADLRPFHIGEDLNCVKNEQFRKLSSNQQAGAEIFPLHKPDGRFCLASLKTAKLAEASLANTRLPLAMLDGAELVGADLQSANLRETELEGAHVERAKLQGADLRGANLQEADLSLANFQGADLRGANLQEADLSLANFQGAVLGRANLQRAVLDRANLQGAALLEANLQEADLTGASLQEANLTGAKDLTASQVKAAENWNRAFYSGDFLKDLGLPPDHNEKLKEKLAEMEKEKKAAGAK